MDRIRQGRRVKRFYERRDGVVREFDEVLRVQVFDISSTQFTLDVLVDDEGIHIENGQGDGESK